jgi:hypothetical protein
MRTVETLMLEPIVASALGSDAPLGEYGATIFAQQIAERMGANR